MAHLWLPVSTMLLSIIAALALAAPADPADQLVEDGHFKRARALVEPRLRANPADAHAHYLMARIQRAFGRMDEASAQAEEAVRLEPRNPEHHNVLSQIYGKQAQRAGMFKAFGLARSFKRENAAVLALDPNHAEGLYALVTFSLEAPGVVGGDKAKARATANRLVTLEPVMGWLARSELAEMQNDRAAMEQALLKAYEVDRRHPRVLLALGGYYQGQQRLREAERYAREALAVAPQRSAPYRLLAGIAAQEVRLAELEQILSDAEKSVPDDLMPFAIAAHTLQGKQRELTVAERYFRKYLSQEPEGGCVSHAVVRSDLALVLEKQGRTAEAVRELEAALREMPSLEQAQKDLKRLRR